MRYQPAFVVVTGDALQPGGYLPGPGFEQLVTRGQRANADQPQFFQLPVIALVLTDIQRAQFNLRAERKAGQVIGQIVIRQT